MRKLIVNLKVYFQIDNITGKEMALMIKVLKNAPGDDAKDLALRFKELREHVMNEAAAKFPKQGSNDLLNHTL